MLAALAAAAAAGCVLPDYEESAPWALGLGGIDAEEAYAVAVDRSGGVILGGAFESYMRFDGENDAKGKPGGDGFVARYDGAGNPSWSFVFGAEEPEAVISVAAAPDGGAFFLASIAATTEIAGQAVATAGSAGALLGRLGPAGGLAWARAFFDASGMYALTAGAIAVDSGGDVLVTGNFAGDVDFGAAAFANPTGYDAFVAKFSAFGEPRWALDLTSDGNMTGRGIAVDPEDNVVVTGAYEGTGHFEGTDVGGGGARSLYVVKLGSGGDLLWARGFPAGATMEGLALATDAEGSVLVTGYGAGTEDLGGGPLEVTGELGGFALKLGPLGDHVWSRSLDGPDRDQGQAIAADAAGRAVIGGTSGFTGDGSGMDVGGDGFLTLLDAADGAPLSSAVFGDASAQRVHGVALDGLDDVVLAGGFEGALALEPATLQSKGLLDIFVTKLAHP